MYRFHILIYNSILYCNTKHLLGLYLVFYTINFANNLPVFNIFYQCKHVNIFLRTKLRLNLNYCDILLYIAIQQFITCS